MTPAAPARQSETDLMREILAALSAAHHPDGIFWRVNVGRAINRNGSVIRFGLAGQADIAGVLRGRHVEVEVKTPSGRQSDAQRRWQAAVERASGIYVLARSVDEALNGVSAGMAAQ